MPKLTLVRPVSSPLRQSGVKPLFEGSTWPQSKLISEALCPIANVQEYQITDGPSWINSQYWDIAAKT